MTKKEKLFKKIMSKPLKTNIKWNEATALLFSLGYETLEGEGSRVKFYHKEADNLICLHKPHPGDELKKYQVKLLQENLREHFE